MKISKYQAANKRCLIKSNTYSNSIEFINQLAEIAKTDFSTLKDSDIEVRVYNDERWNGQVGIEFKGTATRPDYQQIERLPNTYN